MPELGPYGSVRGANSRPYRESERRTVKVTRLTQLGHPPPWTCVDKMRISCH
jgi:hypothetical protein